MLDIIHLHEANLKLHVLFHVHMQHDLRLHTGELRSRSLIVYQPLITLMLPNLPLKHQYWFHFYCQSSILLSCWQVTSSCWELRYVSLILCLLTEKVLSSSSSPLIFQVLHFTGLKLHSSHLVFHSSRCQIAPPQDSNRPNSSVLLSLNDSLFSFNTFFSCLTLNLVA